MNKSRTNGTIVTTIIKNKKLTVKNKRNWTQEALCDALEGRAGARQQQDFAFAMALSNQQFMQMIFLNLLINNNKEI